jgi:putative DNA methylase
MSTAPKRKLIEVSIPLEAINVASAREKSIRHGHPSTLHLWWARRPLAACRAVLFASLVDDPSSDPDRFPSEEDQNSERQRLFRIIERLVLWENSTNETVLEEAREEIRRSTSGNPPPVLDPFCGGGSIPLEAQRLGLTAYASDLNPVAVLITKALIEIPPKFANMPPVHPDARRGVGSTGAWKGAAGLAEDVRRYGGWMRDEAERRVGHLYPKARLPKEHGGGEATVIVWIWARTVTCPNPACGAEMPLVHSFELSKKKGHEAWVEPIVDRIDKSVRFDVRTGRGTPPPPTKTGRGANFRCLVCEQVAPDGYVKTSGLGGRMGVRLIAIVADGERGRIYLPPSEEQELIANSAAPAWGPEAALPDNARWFSPPLFGMTRYSDLFTKRQLVALTTFSDLVGEAREQVLRDAVAAGLPDDRLPLADGGRSAPAYADAVATYLGLSVDRLADRNSSLCGWDLAQAVRGREAAIRNVFARQALPMVWDFAESNIMAEGAGSYDSGARSITRVIEPMNPLVNARAVQADATGIPGPTGVLISTDPPYYDNIGYADLSDFFYVWLRRSLRSVYPELFGTLLTPKVAELVATPYRFDGNKARAERHFESGLGAAFGRIRELADPSVPITIYYAFKQAESDDGGGSGPVVASTGWQTMLAGLVAAGLAIVGTWPLRTERAARSVSIGTNALASSIVLVCRPRLVSAPLATYREFTQALSAELPMALAKLQQANIAPVDLAQAAIGPGMAVFTSYSGVLEQATGGRMTVRRALELINAELDAFLTSEHGDLDRDTRWCHTWFRSSGFAEGAYGSADTLATARNVSVAGLQDAGVLVSGGGKVRLLRPHELNAAWDPLKDERLTVWECTHQLVRALHDPKGGIEGAARLVARMGQGRAAEAKDLAYGLFGICERKGWPDEAGDYNDLVIEWPAIAERAREIGATGQQDTLGI